MKTELVTTLKRQATKILAELHESKEPVLITEHGQPSAYLIDEPLDFNDNTVSVQALAQGSLDIGFVGSGTAWTADSTRRQNCIDSGWKLGLGSAHRSRPRLVNAPI